MAGKTVTVAYEEAHECREGCACESPYIDRVRAALADLGSTDPEGDIAKSSRYVRGARKAGLEPNQAAAMIMAMSRQDPASYVPRHRFEDFAGESGDDYLTTQRKAYDYWMSVGNQPGMLQSMTPDEHLQSAVRAETEAARDDQEAMRLEAAGSTRSAHVARLNAAKYRGFALAHRELMGRKRLMPVGASETAAHDYEAVDSRGRRVFGPTKNYEEAKLHASRAGGVVRFTMGASEARDGKLEDKEAIADHLRAEGHGDDYIRTAIGDEAFAKWQAARATGAADFNSYSSMLQSAKRQGWTHIADHSIAGFRGLPEDWTEIVLKRFGSGWTVAPVFNKEGRWHVGGSDVERYLETLPPGAEPIGGAAEPRATGAASPAAQEHVSYHDRQKLPATAFALRRRRALLLTDKHGKVTAGHVKAAAARLSMMKREGHVTKAEHEEAHAAIARAGKKVGIDVSEAGECPAWYAAMEDERPELSPFDGKMHWHRSDGGDYYADAGPHGRVWVRQREQDKRRGVLRWFATVQKVEVAQGEVKGDVQGAAEKYVRKGTVGAAEHGVLLVPQGDVDVLQRDPDASSPGPRLSTAKQVHAYMKDRAARSGHEQFFILPLSKQDELLGQPILIASGQTDRVAVNVAQCVAAVATATEKGSTAIWACHFHPSGHGQEPSDADRDLTKRIKKAMEAATPDVTFKGHLVLAQESWSRA